MAQNQTIIINQKTNVEIKVSSYGAKKDKHRLRAGDVFFIDFRNSNNHVQRGIRPAIVLGDSNILKYDKSPIIQVVPLTTCNKLKKVHVEINESFLRRSYAIPEQVTTIDISQILDYKGHVSEKTLACVKDSVRAQLGL